MIDEEFLDALPAPSTPDQIDATGKCWICAQGVEHVTDIKDPFWRHVDGRGIGRKPHGALVKVCDGCPTEDECAPIKRCARGIRYLQR